MRAAVALLLAPALAAGQPDTPGWGGGTGLLRVPSAEAGTPGAWRGAVSGAFFQSSSFPVPHNTNRFFGGELALGMTFLEGLQGFASYRSSSNFNAAGTPSLVLTQGDFAFGARGALEAAPSLFVGGEATVGLHTGVGEDLLALGSTEVLLRAVASFETLALDEVPLRLHAAAGARLGNGSGPEDPALAPALQFGVGLAGFHRIEWALGAQMVFGRLAPFLEITSELPLGTKEGAFALGGARLAPGLRAILGEATSVTLALELGLGGGVTAGFAGPPPYQVVLAFATAVLPAPPPAPPAPPPPPERIVVQVQVPAPPPEPTTGTLAGLVADQTGRPVAGAIVTAVGTLPVATDERGRFRVAELPAGSATFRASRAGFLDAGGMAVIDAGSETVVGLVLDPEPPRGTIVGRVTDGRAGVAAQILLAGGAPHDTARDGAFTVTVPPGRHAIVAAAPGRLARASTVEVQDKALVPVEIALAARPAAPAIRADGEKLVLATPWKLDDAASEPPPGAAQALDELADLLFTDPGVRLVVTARADLARSPPEGRRVMTQRWAEGIKRALVARGVAPERIEALGLAEGAKKRRLDLTLVRADK